MPRSACARRSRCTPRRAQWSQAGGSCWSCATQPAAAPRTRSWCWRRAAPWRCASVSRSRAGWSCGCRCASASAPSSRGRVFSLLKIPCASASAPCSRGRVAPCSRSSCYTIAFASACSTYRMCGQQLYFLVPSQCTRLKPSCNFCITIECGQHFCCMKCMLYRLLEQPIEVVLPGGSYCQHLAWTLGRSPPEAPA